MSTYKSTVKPKFITHKVLQLVEYIPVKKTNSELAASQLSIGD